MAPARWTLIGNSPAYLVDTAAGAFGVSRAAGGVPGFAFAGLESAYRVAGDFDARVDFRNAVIKRVNGAPGTKTVALGFTLQNNGTTDATAVWFDDFRLEAERLIPPWQPPAITTVTIGSTRWCWGCVGR